MRRGREAFEVLIANCKITITFAVHWGRVGDKCSIPLCVVSLKISNGGNRCSSRGEALAVRADGCFRHLGKADVASGASDGAIGEVPTSD